jgi:lipopolysaccharide/colanic/teichoic acid biosynthesis glycosyltransferase
MYRRWGKRLIDLSGALFALVLLAPIMLATALVVWATLGRPVLFRQQRIGWRNEPFEIWKFRSMHEASDRNGALRSDEERVTRITRYLRAMSLDELPNIFNVLSGKMSLVGPRPLVPSDVACHGAGHPRRHEVRPGVTGLSQVSGRNQLAWSKRFELDDWYVDHLSFYLDIVIIVRTVLAVFRGTGERADVRQPAAIDESARGAEPASPT